MSLYNAINGFNPACLFVFPMLDRKQEEYPRFRDCFVNEGKIEIYTRVGGNNRGCGFGEEKLYEDPNFVTTYDDEFDNTYATYVFNVPERWKEDFDKIMSGNISEVSDEYYKHVCEFFPLLAEKGVLAKAFKRTEEEDTSTQEERKW